MVMKLEWFEIRMRPPIFHFLFLFFKKSFIIILPERPEQGCPLRGGRRGGGGGEVVHVGEDDGGRLAELDLEGRKVYFLQKKSNET